MSLLTIIQNVADDLALDSPTTVIGNANTQVKQLLQLAQREGRDLSKRFPWKALTVANTFTYATAKDQGAVNGTVVSTSDFDYIINGTFWNQTTNEPLDGPISAMEIEQITALPVNGPYERFYFLGKNLYIDPAPTTADTGGFQYISTHWCESSAAAGQDKWTADDDVGRLDESLMELGIIWRFLRKKGMDYAEELRTYESRLADAIAREGGKRIINMGVNKVYRRYVQITPVP